MFIQTQETPNPNSLKFIPGKGVSNDGPYEFLNENQTEIPILKKILSINGVTGIFLSEDFLSINKSQDEKWENIKHIVISHLNEYYEDGSEFIINKNITPNDSKDFGEIEKKIIKILKFDLLLQKMEEILRLKNLKMVLLLSCLKEVVQVVHLQL